MASKTCEQKRNRSSNFTKEEELILLQEVAKFKNIIECKITNKITKKEKDEAWNKILLFYNSKKELQARKLEQLQAKYDNLKSKAKKNVADVNRHIKGTGGGPAYRDNLDPVTEAVLNLINYKTVVGLESNCDSDSVMISVSETSSCSHPQPSVTYEAVPLDEPYDIEYNEDDVIGVNNINPDVYKMPILPEATQEEIRQNNVEVNGDVKSASKNVPADWSSYTPSKLKKKTSKQLRPTITNPLFLAKEGFYKRKLEYLEKAEERHRIEFESKQKRDEEEHKKRMILLDLEIEIKKRSFLKNYNSNVIVNFLIN